MKIPEFIFFVFLGVLIGSIERKIEKSKKLELEKDVKELIKKEKSEFHDSENHTKIYIASNSSAQITSTNPINTPKKIFEPILGVETQALIKRAFLFMEDNETLEAERYFEQALRQDPENSSAYLGKLMIELNVHNLEELGNIPGSLKEQKLFQRALQFAHNEEKTKLEHCLEVNNEKKYTRAVAMMTGKIVSSENAQNIIDILMSIVPYKDSEALIQEIMSIKQKLEQLEKKYSDAWNAKGELDNPENLKNPDIEKFNSVAELFEELGDYKDGKSFAEEIRKLGIERVKEAEKNRKKKNIIEVMLLLVLIIIFALLVTPSLRKNIMINKAKNGDSDAQLKVALIFYEEEDNGQAFYWFEKAAEQGNAEAQYRLGRMYNTGSGTKRDDDQAFLWYKKAVEQGYSDAKIRLDAMYQDGKNEKRDYEQIFQYYKKFAEIGNAEAQFMLGIMYYLGRGTKQDYKQAFQWYKKAAEQGYTDAQNYLGNLYYSGEGTKQDYEQAFQWYKKAAEQDNAYAQNFLGVMYLRGRGVEVNYNKAQEWFRKALANDPDSNLIKINLGYTYELQGNISKAHEWYNIAASQSTSEDINTYRRMVSEGNTRSPKSFLKYFDEIFKVNDLSKILRN